jgi:hypothetical protein
MRILFCGEDHVFTIFYGEMCGRVGEFFDLKFKVCSGGRAQMRNVLESLP